MMKYACPYCKNDVRDAGNRVECPKCGRQFTVRDDIPLFCEVQDNADLQTVRRLIDELRNRQFGENDADGRFMLPDRVWDRSSRLSEEKSFRSFTRYFDPVAMRILVVSAGAGREVNRLLKLGAREIYFTDISFDAVKYVYEAARQRHAGPGIELHGFVSDAAFLPFGDNAFDLVLVYASIHHYPDIAAFLAEARRVARNICILSEPAVMSVFQPVLERMQWDKKNDYSAEIETHRVSAAGCSKLLAPHYRTVRVERVWTFYPRFLGRWGNNPLFVGLYFAGLRFLDMFFGWCSHSVNFYALDKR